MEETEVIELNLSEDKSIDDAVEENHVELMVKSVQKEKIAQRGGKVLWRGTNVIMAIFFVMAAGVQFNDPDPYLWVPLYGIAALLTGSVAVVPALTSLKKWQWIYWIHTGFCLGMFIYVFVELVIVATNPLSDGSLNPLTYEEGRELAGIMITTVWMFICKQSPTISFEEAERSRTESAVFLSIVIFSLVPIFLWALCYSNVMNASYISMCGDFFIGEFSF